MLAIIPARGGSKGLPGKNLLKLGGESLVARAVHTALRVPEISRVVVTTEDPQIADAALDAGAEVPFLRPSALASDTAVARDVYLHACDTLDPLGNIIDSFVVLQPTSPLRSSDDVLTAISNFREHRADAVLSVSLAPHPPSWFMKMSASGQLSGLFGTAVARNRQDEDASVVPNGVAFVFRRSFLAHSLSYLSDRTFSVIVPRERSIDIDDQLDYDFAEFLLSRGGLE